MEIPEYSFILQLALSALGTFAIACSDAGASITADTAGGANNSATGNTCNVPKISWYNATLGTKSGSGKLLMNGMNYNLAELACETRRNAQGSVIGYAVSFAEQTTWPTVQTVIELTAYTGDGMYPNVYSRNYTIATGSTSVSYRNETQVTLTISQSGKHGIVTTADDTYHWEYTCDGSDDTTTDSTSSLGDPAPGTAYVVVNGQQVNFFKGVACEYNSTSGELDASGPDAHDSSDGKTYGFWIRVDKTEPGTHDAQLWMTYFDIDKAYNDIGTATLTCGMHVTGSFTATNSTAGTFTGKFTCPD